MNLHDLKTIKALAEIMKDNGLTAITLKDSEDELVLERSCPPAPAAVPVPVAAAPAAAPSASAPAPASPEIKGGAAVKSPMVGVFYSAPSPEEKPYVQVGDKVHKGDVLCIVEAMKLMNEITAEQDGEIVEICAEDGGLVEYGQTLFIMK